MFYCVYQSIFSRFLNLSPKKLSHKIKLNLQENLLFLGEGTIAIIVHDVRYLRISGWRPQHWITATTIESTAQQHLISSPVFSWLSSYNTNVNGDAMSRFKVKLIVKDQDLFELELSHPDLFSVVIYPRSYHFFRHFSLVDVHRICTAEGRLRKT